MPFTHHLRYTLQSLWFYAPSVITILIGYFLLTKLTQGQDVVMLVGEAGWPVVFTAIGVTLWAFFVWYCSRLLGYEKKFIDTDWPLPYLSLFPRLLAYNTFVTVQAAIVALPTVGSDNAYFLWAFVILHNGYYFVLNNAFKTKTTAWRAAAIFIAVVYIAYLVFLFIRPKGETAHQLQLPWVALLLFGFQILALYFFIQRRVSIDKNALHDVDETKAENKIDFVTLFSIEIIKVPAWLKAQEQRTFLLFNIMATLAIILYLTILNSLWAANGLGPLPVVLLAFGILAGLATLITYFSMRVKFSLFFVLLVIAMVAGNFFDPYSVKLTETKTKNVFQQRPSLETYLENWIAQRKAKIDSATDAYPVYLVLADGGASRSGYWAASVLAAWQKKSLADAATTGTFSDHLPTGSTTTGGATGAVGVTTGLGCTITAGTDIIKLVGNQRTRTGILCKHQLSPGEASVLVECHLHSFWDFDR